MGRVLVPPTPRQQGTTSTGNEADGIDDDDNEYKESTYDGRIKQ
jgi:hypothetical protein